MHPKIDVIMNVIDEKRQVLPVLVISDTVETSRFIPIPLFLIATFMDSDKEMDVIKECQVFYDEFFKKAPK